MPKMGKRKSNKKFVMEQKRRRKPKKSCNKKKVPAPPEVTAEVIVEAEEPSALSTKDEEAAFWAELNADLPESTLSYLRSDDDVPEFILSDDPPDAQAEQEETYSEMQRYNILVEDDRYDVLGFLGSGTFGIVFKVQDKGTNELYALKVLRSKWCVGATGDDWEFKFGVKLTKAQDEAGKESRIIRFPNAGQDAAKMLSFGPQELPGFLMELLEGPNVWEFMMSDKYQPFRNFHWQSLYHIASQACEGLQFMHSCGLLHTDIKTENIAFVRKPHYINRAHPIDPKRIVRMLEDPSVKIIDLGTVYESTEAAGSKDIFVNSAPYRGPEVILKQGWGFHSDIWSMGVALYEMYTGGRMFDLDLGTHQQLKDMENRLGALPKEMLKRAGERRKLNAAEKRKQNTAEFSDEDFITDAPNPDVLVTKSGALAKRYAVKLGGRHSPDAKRNVTGAKQKKGKGAKQNTGIVRKTDLKFSDSEEMIGCLETAKRCSGEKRDSISHEYFKLLRRMLEMYPKKRINADEVLQHRFFEMGKEAYVD